MANDTFEGLAGKLLLRCPSAGPFLARDWIRNAWHDLVRRRQWSWRWKSGNIQIPNQYVTGTVSINVGGQTVTLVIGVVSSDWVGRQFRVGTNSPILTITSVNVGANTFDLDQQWYGQNVVSSAYVVYQAYYFMPSDLEAISSVVDPRNQYPVSHVGETRQGIDLRDPQRSAGGAPPKFIVPFDFYNGRARFELWPHQYVQGFLALYYISKPIDAFDAGAAVPYTIDSDIILERALSYCARWPGSSRENPNPYYSDPLAQYHNNMYEDRVGRLTVADNELMNQNIKYQSTSRRGIPSASWAQQHDIG